MAIQSMQMPDGTVLKFDEWLHWPVFSTIEFAFGQKVSLDAFSYTSGMPVPQIGLTSRNSTDVDTNQTVVRRTNQDEALVVYCVTYEAFGLTDADANPATAPTAVTLLAASAPSVARHSYGIMCRDMLVELYVGAGITKPQLRVPFDRLSQGVGPVIHGTYSNTFAAGPPAVLTQNGPKDLATAGKVTTTNQWRLELPIVIESDRNFYLKTRSFYALTELNQSIRLRYYLDCMKRRPIA